MDEPSAVHAPGVGRPYPGRRPVWAEIDLGAVRHNAALLRRLAAPAALCAVVKADGYGHGAVPVARAALEGGAVWLAVALVEEGVALRDAGIGAPVLVLSEPTPEAMATVVARGLTPTLYTRAAAAAAADAAAAAGVALDVHVKVDTGMHRVGADPSDVVDLVRAVTDAEALRVGALWTHLAVADEVGTEADAFTVHQLRLFAETRAALTSAGLDRPLLHVANSAGAIAYPEARLDMVRCGIALYGVLPTPAVAPAFAAATRVEGGRLRPVLSLKAQVSRVRSLDAGERPSYGRRRALSRRSVVATVPLGYADGVPRRYFTHGGTVLIGGHRRPLAGVVTMDQIVVDCGPDAPVSVGDEVVLIGRQGDASLTAWDWAEVLDTIGHEVLTGIGARVPRVVCDTGPAGAEVGPTVVQEDRR